MSTYLAGLEIIVISYCVCLKVYWYKKVSYILNPKSGYVKPIDQPYIEIVSIQMKIVLWHK